ncbi:MAG TPA: aldehyde dehydrogenase family protein, partial [Candidatus Baltobacteraceae bacterium]|nr:aldehyde dehydrogenase family protein [Candidatus Baltobacteraceae bacterium]
MKQIDHDLQTLDASKDAWARLPIERKIVLFEGLKRSIHALAPEWVRLASDAKGLLPGSPLAGEEWMSGPWAVMYALNRYIRTLRGIASRGESPVPRPRVRADGRTVLDVFPRTLYDRLLLNGISAQVWMQPGVSREDVAREAAPFYGATYPHGRVALVLGAGNIASIPPLDVLYKLVAAGSVCMLKMNPVNAYLGNIFERAFASFADAGYLRFAYGGADVGEYMCAHDLVQEIHITGSEVTHNAILARIGKDKRVTSELGNVSPTIVIPGRWSDDDLAFQAENIATQKAHNAGFNCVASQMLVLPKEWHHTSSLRERVERVFERMEQRPEYYPGASQRRTALAGPSTSLRSIVQVDAASAGDPAFSTEAFCGVLACVELPGDVGRYTRDAVAFANDRLRGTLGANLVVHPETMKSHAQVIDRAIADLRYGCVAVNGWTGVGYFITETPWGAYPGHTLDDVGSGIGVVHNSYLLERTEKSVIHAPFSPFPRSVRSGQLTLLPRPPWFVTNGMQAEIGRALCDFEMSPSPARAMRIASLAMR